MFDRKKAKLGILGEIAKFARGGMADELKGKFAKKPIMSVTKVEAAPADDESLEPKDTLEGTEDPNKEALDGIVEKNPLEPDTDKAASDALGLDIDPETLAKLVALLKK